MNAEKLSATIAESLHKVMLDLYPPIKALVQSLEEESRNIQYQKMVEKLRGESETDAATSNLANNIANKYRLDKGAVVDYKDFIDVFEKMGEKKGMSPPPLNCVCGNCKHFSDESATGEGWCNIPSWNGETDCGASCSEWEHRPLEEGDAVMYKTSDPWQGWKLGYYSHKDSYGHCVYCDRVGSRTQSATVVEPFDTFDPYSND